jgi:hypothetical protein
LIAPSNRGLIALSNHNCSSESGSNCKPLNHSAVTGAQSRARLYFRSKFQNPASS